MARKTGLLGTAYVYRDKTEKTRQGRGKHSKYSATSRNSKPIVRDTVDKENET